MTNYYKLRIPKVIHLKNKDSKVSFCGRTDVKAFTLFLKDGQYYIQFQNNTVLLSEYMMSIRCNSCLNQAHQMRKALPSVLDMLSV